MVLMSSSLMFGSDNSFIVTKDRMNVSFLGLGDSEMAFPTKSTVSLTSILTFSVLF